MSEASFRIPGRFHPPSSPLGRVIARTTGDSLRAEAQYLFAAGAIAVGAVLLYFLGGTLTGGGVLGGSGAPSVDASPLLRWALALGTAAAYFFGVVYGREDPIEVRVDEDAVHAARSDAALRVPIDTIRRIERVSARTYHRHHRKYARTRHLVNRAPETVLLLHTDGGPLALGLDPDDRRALERLLDRVRPSESAGQRSR